MYWNILYKTFVFFPIMENLWSVAFINISYVGAVISTLMYVSDGLGLYIFCRGMGKIRPMEKKNGWKLIFFRQSRRYAL